MTGKGGGKRKGRGRGKEVLILVFRPQFCLTRKRTSLNPCQILMMTNESQIGIH